MKQCLKLTITSMLMCLVAMPLRAQLTLDYCIERATENYPVIKKYDIVGRTAAIDLSSIDKCWLPQVSVYAQGTLQNNVPRLPEALGGILEQMGQEMDGLGKAQYKAGIDVTQNVWDGGTSQAQRDMARAREAEQQAALDVEMYAIRERVESIYFGILLMSEQADRTRSTLQLLESNLEQMRALRRNGAATQSDADMVEAQKLAVAQQLVSAEGTIGAYRRLLEVFMGETTEGKTLSRPSADMPADMTTARPELRLFDAQLDVNNARLSSVRASLMPHIGLFAQAYYGYPGLDYFASMRSRDMSFNILAGVKVSWNMSSLYNRSNDHRRVALANASVSADRDRFLFENRLGTAGKLAEIATMREVMARDSDIVRLRANVRKAAESQLRNGVIDATSLLTKIDDENQALLTATYHEIEMLRLIYQLKNTLNR